MATLPHDLKPEALRSDRFALKRSLRQRLEVGAWEGLAERGQQPHFNYPPLQGILANPAGQK